MTKSSCPMLRMCAILLALLYCQGCGNGDAPDLAEVTGRVTLDGYPVERAGIEFTPIEGTRIASYGLTDKEGNYRMRFTENLSGAVIGRTSVRIESAKPAIVGGKSFGLREVFPRKYNAETELQVVVEPGPNVHDFALTTPSGDIVKRVPALQPNENP